MKKFLSRILTCAIPSLIATCIVAVALWRFYHGQGGIKLGVDLAGGADLIYEVDTSKFRDQESGSQFDIQKLVAQLKRRIDPADLYNVTIRPVGANRVEIILPTGGQHQAAADLKAWNELLESVARNWTPKTYAVPVGRVTELIARVNEQDSSIPIKDIQGLIRKHFVLGTDGSIPPGADEAWKKLIDDVSKSYPPKRYAVGLGRIPTLVNRVREQYPEVSAREVEDFIGKAYNIGKGRRQFTSEQIQEVKELISRVGSLEFKILANSTDDKPALDAAVKYFQDAQKDPAEKRKLESLAIAGKAPPGPVSDERDDTFEVANDPDVRHAYSWVELGQAERNHLRLSNAMADSPWWKEVAEAREKGEAVRVPANIHAGGILLYSRPAINPRLPENEAAKKIEYFVLTRDAEKGKEITGDNLAGAYETPGQLGELQIGFRFDAKGARLFQELTTKNRPEDKSEAAFRRQLSVILDKKIESTAGIEDVISESGVIRRPGGFEKYEVDRMVKILRAGALPASLKPQPVSENTMGATLGAHTIRAGSISVVLAFLAVMVFMVIYYRFAGVVACIALLANLLLTIAFMVAVNATFTLPGLAGLVLMLGMAVDANVLIYERLREERERGASLALALRNGYDRAFPTIIDTHLSSIFTAVVLYVMGNDQLKGFGISLTAGLIISLFTSLYMTRLMFDLWQHKGWLSKLSMLRLFSRPSIDFMAIRYYLFAATSILTVVGAAIFLGRLNSGGLNIDFTKGTAYGFKLTRPVTIQELRGEILKGLEDDLEEYSLEQILVSDSAFGEGNKGMLFTVRTSNQDADKVQLLVNNRLGDLLDRTTLSSYEIDQSNRRAVLSFSPPASDQPAFASRSQVSLLLSKQFSAKGERQAAESFVLEGLGTEEAGSFQWMELQLLQPLGESPAQARSKLDAILKATKDELAARPQPQRLENIDPQLATDTQKTAAAAIVTSWLAILAYLWFRFGNWTFGLAAVLCLIHDLFFTLGIIGFCHYIHKYAPGLAGIFLIQDFKIDLPAVAALLTLVGYSVNDTIVVFDRIREVRGKNPVLTPETINDSVNQTLSRTLLTSIATWLVVIVLYIWGGEGIHLFAFVMIVGVIVGTFSSIYVASPLLLIFGEGRKGDRTGMARRAEPTIEKVAAG